VYQIGHCSIKTLFRGTEHRKSNTNLAEI